MNLHALAIDEHRVSFEPTPWRQPAFGSTSGEVEQVWFAGAHSDVGGGYIDEDLRECNPALDDITLDWMLKRVTGKYSDFPAKNSARWLNVCDASALAPQHQTRRGFYKLLPTALRSINNTPVPTRYYEKNVGRDRHAKTIGECIHESVFRRCGELVQVDGRTQYYAPANLIAALKAMSSSIGASHPPRIVDFAGKHAKRDQAEALLESARQRLRNIGLWERV